MSERSKIVRSQTLALSAEALIDCRFPSVNSGPGLRVLQGVTREALKRQCALYDSRLTLPTHSTCAVTDLYPWRGRTGNFAAVTYAAAMVRW